MDSSRWSRHLANVSKIVVTIGVDRNKILSSRLTLNFQLLDRQNNVESGCLKVKVIMCNKFGSHIFREERHDYVTIDRR